MKTKVKIMQFKKDGTITEKLVNITNLYYVYFDGKNQFLLKDEIK